MKKRYLAIPVLFITISILMPLRVFAFDAEFYSNNNILFFNPDDTSTCSSDNSAAVGSISLAQSDSLQHIFQTLLDGGMSAVQAAAVMGNMYGESGFRPDANEGGGGPGYGLVQWSFGRRTSLEAYATEQGKPVSDLDLQLSFLLKEYNETYKARLANTTFAVGGDIASATQDWMLKFEVPAMKPANDPAGLNSRRIPAAQTVYGYYSSLSPSSPIVDNSGCSAVGNGVVAGNIVKTAIGLAQPNPVPNGTTNLSQATSAFQQAYAQYNVGTIPSDCGGFVATVMRSSGVDASYPVGTSNQYKYVQDHPEKYTAIYPKTVADLQPGDILVSIDAGHTTIYVGAEGGKYPSVDASLNQRIPSMRDVYSAQYMLGFGDIMAARIIK